MNDDLQVLWFHTKLALVWIVLGTVAGAGMCYYVMKDAKRPVVEIRLDPRVSAAGGPAGTVR
jgi:hypothetical protein